MFMPKLEFSSIQGLFKQGEVELSSAAFLPNFGILDEGDHGWQVVGEILVNLNATATPNTTYKLLWLARDALAFHDVAEGRYGSASWIAKWSKLETDGQIRWGPDASLTPTGEAQARFLGQGVESLLKTHPLAPIPQSLYCSPLTRAASTLCLTWDGLVPRTVRREFKEGLRATMGVYTCDKRRTRTAIATAFPSFTFEASFAERDRLWRSDYRECPLEQTFRVRQALEEIFLADSNAVLGITTHGGVMSTVLDIIGYRSIHVPVAAILPVLVKAVKTR